MHIKILFYFRLIFPGPGADPDFQNLTLGRDHDCFRGVGDSMCFEQFAQSESRCHVGTLASAAMLKKSRRLRNLDAYDVATIPRHSKKGARE